MSTSDLEEQTADDVNLDGEKCCPYHLICHNYLTPQQYFECYNNKNLCSKADMVQIKMLNEILDCLADLDKHL